jgi:hypothetical protein
MACCVYHTTAHVVRLFNSDNDKQPKVFHGNVCAHEMNLVSTADKLPRTPQDINGSISVVFIGPEKFKADVIHKLFRIRRNKVWVFLCWLKFTAKNPLYADIPLSDDNLLQFSENEDVLPGIYDRIIHDVHSNSRQVFEEESAGIDNRPAADLVDSADGEPVFFLENMGVSDPECDNISGNVATASALRNMFIRRDRDPNEPDLILHHSHQAVPEYQNPSLFPGMYPTLFPYGIGGFEVARSVKISFEVQANYLLDVCDRNVRYHHSFLFVVFNMLQRRRAHLRTYMLVQQDRFDNLARMLHTLDHSIVLQVAKRLETEKQLFSISEEEHKVFDLFREVKAISAHIPGSSASKLTSRNQIRGYMGLFGMPVLFFTCNPNAVHSPMFLQTPRHVRS